MSEDDDALVWKCPCLFQADPDIAGIGVICSFVIAAVMANISTCLYLMLFRCGCSPQEEIQSFHRSIRSEDFNPIDRFMRHYMDTKILSSCREVSWLGSLLDRLEQPLSELVQSLADVQLATGIAMLTAAIIRLNHGTITVYHFNTVLNLAWLSSNVHLLALLVIRTKILKSMKQGQRPSYRSRGGGWKKAVQESLGAGLDVIIRVSGMLFLAGLLLYGSYVSGAEGWYDNYNCPASCSLGRRKAGSPEIWMVANFVLVLWEYPRRCLMLWPSAWEIWLDRLRHRVVDDKSITRLAAGTSKLPLWRRLFNCVWYVLASETLDVLVGGIVWFSLGVWWIYYDRNYMYSVSPAEESEKENIVDGFGQLVPLLVLGVPLLQAIHTYCAIKGKWTTCCD
ncbi:hypothetical protein ASPCAL06074 [Aspergillus calidoustus]|uniref:Uncharacterized protein n=1 Tax=Aspergillus calidoustus TaxID=454130 RepID=A0A0U5G1G1_ASPCI|nr:hypothetical protein ASPCAL06074 [Aspergillus calidoustus]